MSPPSCPPLPPAGGRGSGGLWEAAAPGCFGRRTQQGVPHIGELVTALVSVACGSLASLSNTDGLLDPPATLTVFKVNDLYVGAVHDMT